MNLKPHHHMPISSIFRFQFIYIYITWRRDSIFSLATLLSSVQTIVMHSCIHALSDTNNVLPKHSTHYLILIYLLASHLPKLYKQDIINFKAVNFGGFTFLHAIWMKTFCANDADIVIDDDAIGCCCWWCWCSEAEKLRGKSGICLGRHPWMAAKLSEKC